MGVLIIPTRQLPVLVIVTPHPPTERVIIRHQTASKLRPWRDKMYQQHIIIQRAQLFRLPLPPLGEDDNQEKF